MSQAEVVERHGNEIEGDWGVAHEDEVRRTDVEDGDTAGARYPRMRVVGQRFPARGGEESGDSGGRGQLAAQGSLGKDEAGAFAVGDDTEDAGNVAEKNIMPFPSGEVFQRGGGAKRQNAITSPPYRATIGTAVRNLDDVGPVGPHKML